MPPKALPPLVAENPVTRQVIEPSPVRGFQAMRIESLISSNPMPDPVRETVLLVSVWPPEVVASPMFWTVQFAATGKPLTVPVKFAATTSTLTLRVTDDVPRVAVTLNW